MSLAGGSEAGSGRWGSIFDRLYDPVTCEAARRRMPGPGELASGADSLSLGAPR